MDISIRRTRPDELDIMCKLDLAIFGEEDAFDTPDLWEGLETFLILYDDISVVGSAALRHNTSVAVSYEADYLDKLGSLYVVSIGVLHGWQGRGIGTIAMTWLINYGRERGFERIVSNARNSNQQSIDLHIKCNFQVTRTIPNWYGNESTAVMELKL